MTCRGPSTKLNKIRVLQGVSKRREIEKKAARERRKKTLAPSTQIGQKKQHQHRRDTGNAREKKRVGRSASPRGISIGDLAASSIVR